MKKSLKISALILIMVSVLSFSACDPVDSNYAVSSENDTKTASAVKKASDDIKRPPIMSDDDIMPHYIDISIFDEENYSEVYLGKKFKFHVEYAGSEFSVPSSLSKIGKKGWLLKEGNEYNKESLVYAGDSVDAVFANSEGAEIKATFYNSSNSSVKLKNCRIVKFKIENDFYTKPNFHNEFNVNGVNNKMAITDIIDTLGFPSHFYGIAENNYYLDYFISEKDRRNGITVYINPSEDSVTAVEFSYYK